MITTVKESFDGYRQRVIPMFAGHVQVRECKRAFYAGAATMLSVMIDACGMTEEEAIKIVSKLNDECVAFCDEVKKEIG